MRMRVPVRRQQRIGAAGIELSRPEDPDAFALPDPNSGILLTMGAVGSVVVVNRISREMSKGSSFEEVFDGVITGMAMYAMLEHMRKVHRHALEQPVVVT